MEDEIAELTGRSFSLHKLAPLYDFFSKSLEHWENDISQHMISQLKLKTWEESARPNPSENCKGDLVGIRFDSLYFDSLSFYNADMKPLKISIEIVYFSKRGRQIHTFFLLPSPYAPREDAAFVYYPLVLAKAPTPVVRAMVVWFNAKFFARMDPMLIPADIMLSSIQIWVNSIVDLKKEHNDMIEMIPASMSILPLHLEYTSADPALSDIQLELSQEQAFNILDMVPQDLFYDSFSKHIRNTTGIVLSSIVLRRVSTSLASMRNDGLLKISGYAYKVYAVQLLQNLIELAASQLY